MNNDTPYPKGLYVLAVVHILTAFGVGAFWVEWFSSGNHLTFEPECQRIFENTFPVPDTIMSLLLIATAVFLFKKSPYALLTGYFAAGMSLYLASLDTLYHFQHGNFDLSDPETPSRIFISIHCYLLGAVTLYYLWRKQGLFIPQSSSPTPAILPRSLRILGALFLLHTASTLLFWLYWFSSPPEMSACAFGFYNAYWLADIISIALCACAALGIFKGGKSCVLSCGIGGMAGLFFGCIGLGGFGTMNPQLLQGSAPFFFSLVALYLAFSLWSIGTLWKYRTRFVC